MNCQYESNYRYNRFTSVSPRIWLDRNRGANCWLFVLHGWRFSHNDRIDSKWEIFCKVLVPLINTRSSDDADKTNLRDAMSSVIGSDDARPSYCVFSIFKMAPSAILDFYVSEIFVKNSNLRLYLRRHTKFGEDRTIGGRVIAYFLFWKWRPSAILDLVWRHIGPPATCVWWS